MRLHEKGTFGLGSAPPFSPEFIRYIGKLECGKPDCRECMTQRKVKVEERWRTPEPRLRATRAFRKLRKVAPREFDALYMYCIQRNTVPHIAAELTNRAIRLDKPERYDNVAVVVLLLSGIDKVRHFW